MKFDYGKKIILDGGTGGNLLERANSPAGYTSELLNLDNPEIVRALQREYVSAGAEVICANTFGANAIKYDGDELKKIVRSGLEIARSVAPKYVALDLGPTGAIVGAGGISRKAAYEAFAKVVNAGKDLADVIFIETVTSLAELRLALLAAKENSTLPVWTSMSFEKNGRTFFGVSAECFAIAANALGADAIGANCSLGPKDLLPLVSRFRACTDKPIIIKPNAGLPRLCGGKTVYDLGADRFAEEMAEVATEGASLLGGCCGTTPEHIRKMRARVLSENSEDTASAPTLLHGTVCSATEIVPLDAGIVIGERINPTGKKKFREALLRGEIDFLGEIAAVEHAEGANLLDVNVGVNGIDEAAVMEKAVQTVSAVCSLPLVIDASSPAALEAGLRAFDGKAVVNSVNGKTESLDSVLPLVSKYGAALIVLPLDENLPETVDKRLSVANKILDKAREYGISPKDVLVDGLTLAESGGRGNALVTLETVEALARQGLKTVLGVSNVSFGMPNREDINAKFLELARGRGLTAAIIDPSKRALAGSPQAEDFLLNRQNSLENYLAFASVAPPVRAESADGLSLADAIFSGRAEKAAEIAETLADQKNLTQIVSGEIMPALDEVGRFYEEGRLFLPQLISSAEAAKRAFAVLEKRFKHDSSASKNVLVLATVKGDIHDIGKNIVKAVVGNYGFEVVDLGKDVDYQTILSAVRAHYPCALGLSALMTTTAVNLKTATDTVRAEFPDIPVLVGGAVVTQEYAESIGCIYCKDATDTVQKLKKHFNS